MYSKIFRKIRKERLKLANNQCELSIHGREICSHYHLECHHKDDISYEKDKLGTLDINDVLVVCVYCHDFLTNARRNKRFNENKLECSVLEQDLTNEVRYGLGRTEISSLIRSSTYDAKCTKRRPN